MDTSASQPPSESTSTPRNRCEPGKAAQPSTSPPAPPAQNGKLKARAIRLLALGHSGRSVARELGVSEATIRNWRRSPPVRRALAEGQTSAREAIVQGLELYGTEVGRTLTDLLEHPDAKLRLTAAVEILNRLGVGADYDLKRQQQASGGDWVDRWRAFWGSGSGVGAGSPSDPA